nr:stress response protein NST1 isoform X5 [Crassostrea gigas]
MDYSIILDFGDEPVRTVDEKLDILRFDYSWAEAVQAAEEEEERKNEIEGMDQKLILEDGTRQFMIQEKRQKEIMEKVLKELMASIAQRDQNLCKEVVAKIERQNEIKMLAFIETQKREKRQKEMEKVHKELMASLAQRDQNVYREAVEKIERLHEIKLLAFLKTQIHEKRQKEIMEKVHKELMASIAQRDQNLCKEAVEKIERHNEMKMLTFLETQKMARKGTLLHEIFVQLVKNIMRRRNPVVAKMMMNNLRQHNTILAAVHEELALRVEQKDKMKKIRALILTEMMTRVEKKEKMKKIRANILTEMMLRFKSMAEAKKTRAVIWLEIMREIRNRQQLPHIQSGTLGYEKVLDHILEKPDVDEEFVPRKLFLFGVDYFNISQEHASEPNTNRDQNLIAVNKDDESPHCFADSAISSMDKDTANDQEKPRRRTLRDRVKKFFGIK